VRVAFFLFSILVVTAVTGTRAQAQNYPWCAIYDEEGDAYNCGFVSFEQCMADLRGIGGSCQQNNTYRPPVTAPLRRKSHTHS
jgi:hypothetical protein